MMTPEKFHQLEQQLEELEQERDQLFSQHDANSGTYLEDEPWYGEYEKLDDEASKLSDLLDQHEVAVMSDEQREFFTPEAVAAMGAAHDFAWDHWQKWAIEDGVPEQLAQLGRAVIREAYQHNWPNKLKAECGWSDDGREMLELAKTDPERAAIRWKYLLESDGDFWWK